MNIDYLAEAAMYQRHNTLFEIRIGKWGFITRVSRDGHHLQRLTPYEGFSQAQINILLEDVKRVGDELDRYIASLTGGEVTSNG